MVFAFLQSALLAAAPVPVAEAAIDSAAVPSSEEMKLGRADDRMTVPVQIAGAGPYRFIIDTGAQRTVVSRELAAELGLPAGRTVNLTAMTETSRVGTVIVSSLSVSPMGTHAIEAPALAAADMGAPGILGIDTLQGHAVQIDFDRRVMAVTPSGRRRHRAEDGEIVVRARSLFGQLVVTDATYRGTRVRVILDTGSAITMGNEALRRRMQRQRAKTQDVQLVSVTGGTMTAGYTQMNQVRVGGVNFSNLPVAFSAEEPFRAFGLSDTPAILLGMDALRLFRRVRIDFANRELRLRPPRDAPRISAGLLPGGMPPA